MYYTIFQLFKFKTDFCKDTNKIKYFFYFFLRNDLYTFKKHTFEKYFAIENVKRVSNQNYKVYIYIFFIIKNDL
jgi:hypothetical protein